MEHKDGILFVGETTDFRYTVSEQLGSCAGPWEAVFARSMHEALHLMERRAFAVAVADLYPSGFAFLQKAKELSPRTVRIIVASAENQKRVMESAAVAHQLLSVPFDGKELASSLARACALGGHLAHETLEGVLGGISTLPPLPGIYFDLMEELRRPAASIEKVATLIGQDGGMTAMILHLVNAAFFGLRHSASSPARAVNLLGLERIRALVIAIQVFSRFPGDQLGGLDLETLQAHSLTVGSLAQAIARSQKGAGDFVETCFTAGLLHDAGKLVLALARHDLGERIRSGVAKGEHQHELEYATLGASHAEVGASLLGLWGLPEHIVDAVAYHHRPGRCMHQEFSPLTAVHVADAFLNELEAGNDACYTRTLDFEYLEGLGLKDRLSSWKTVCDALYMSRTTERG